MSYRIKPAGKKFWLGLAGMALMLAIFAGLRALSAPASGKIHVVQTAAPVVKPITLKSTSGKYVSFSYPSTYTASSPSTPGGTMVESFSLANRNSIPPADLNISIVQLPSGLLADDGSYHFREMNPSTYQLSTWAVGGQAVPVMAEANAYAKAAFLVHGQLCAELSLSGSSVDATTLDSNLKTVLASFKWLANG